jgi:hypothetical protein
MRGDDLSHRRGTQGVRGHRAGSADILAVGSRRVASVSSAAPPAKGSVSGYERTNACSWPKRSRGEAQNETPPGLWVPNMSSGSCGERVFVDGAAEPVVPADPKVVEVGDEWGRGVSGEAWSRERCGRCSLW